MSNHSEFLKQLQRYTAEAAITPAAVRKQGAPGVARAARAYLARSDLERLQKITPKDYSNWLDKETDRLRVVLPRGARHWGTARKVLNIFLRTATYTSPLAARFGLKKLLPMLEVPLDSHVAGKLRSKPEGRELPRWESVKGLGYKQSAEYQMVAQRIANRMKLNRADLDVYFWRADPT
jgi:hypothetical protein